MTVYGITVRNVLLFAGNIPRGVFVNKVHRKPENEVCAANATSCACHKKVRLSVHGEARYWSRSEQ